MKCITLETIQLCHLGLDESLCSWKGSSVYKNIFAISLCGPVVARIGRHSSFIHNYMIFPPKQIFLLQYCNFIYSWFPCHTFFPELANKNITNQLRKAYGSSQCAMPILN